MLSKIICFSFVSKFSLCSLVLKFFISPSNFANLMPQILTALILPSEIIDKFGKIKV